MALSLSERESGVPADNEDLEVRGRLPIGTDRAERSLTYTEFVVKGRSSGATDRRTKSGF